MSLTTMLCNEANLKTKFRIKTKFTTGSTKDRIYVKIFEAGGRICQTTGIKREFLIQKYMEGNMNKAIRRRHLGFTAA